MKTALVTGAARGIGLATTQQFLAKGWRVAMIDWDAEKLTAASQALSNVIALHHDISKPDEVAQIVSKTLAEFGQIDALVNNAGIADFGPIEQTDFERWKAVMSINLMARFYCRKPQLRR